MQVLSLDQWIAILSALFLALIFIFGEGAILRLLRSKPDIRIKKVTLSSLREDRSYMYLEIKNEGKISAPNFNIEIKILGQMKDFGTVRFDGLQPSKIFPSRTLIQPTLGWLVASENVYLVNSTSENYRLAVGHVYKIQVRFTYEGVVEKPRYEIVLNAKGSEHTVHFKELS